MDRLDLLELFDRELRIGLEIPGVRREAFARLVRHIRPAPGMNQVVYSRLEPAELDRAIEAQVRDLSALEQPFTWKVFDHDLPDELPERLIGHGFLRDEEPDAVLILDLDKAPVKWSDLPDGIEVRRLTSAEQLDDVVEIEAQVLGGDFGWLKERLAAHLEVPDYLSVYAAYVEGQPASAGWAYFHAKSQFVSMYGGATLEHLRGRGLYLAIVSARVGEAARRRRRFVTTGAGEMSRPILLRQGFEPLTTSWDYIWQGG